MYNSNSFAPVASIKSLIHGYIERFHHVTQLARLEAKLAIITFAKMSILLIILAIGLLSTWLSILATLFVYFAISLQLGWLWSGFILILLNIVLVLCICITLWMIKDNLLFTATRRQLEHRKS